MAYTCGGSGHPLGSSRCVPEDHYEGCDRSFGSLEAFDWHMREGKCASDSLLRRHGLIQDANGVWRSKMDEEGIARLRGARDSDRYLGDQATFAEALVNG